MCDPFHLEQTASMRHLSGRGTTAVSSTFELCQFGSDVIGGLHRQGKSTRTEMTANEGAQKHRVPVIDRMMEVLGRARGPRKGRDHPRPRPAPEAAAHHDLPHPQHAAAPRGRPPRRGTAPTSSAAASSASPPTSRPALRRGSLHRARKALPRRPVRAPRGKLQALGHRRRGHLRRSPPPRAAANTRSR